VVDGKLYTGSTDSTIRVWDIGNIKSDTQFGLDDKDSAATSGAAATHNAGRPGPPSKTSKSKEKRPQDGGGPAKPAEKSRIMIGDEDESRNITKQGHLISIGKTTSAF